jgi:putative peptidoglycan lipid II flippase
LRFFALGLLGHVCLELAARAFFAQQDTVTPLLVAAAAAAANIGLGLVLMRWLAHGGLALANSLAVSAEVVVLLALLRRRWGSVEGRRLTYTLAKVVLATAVMAGVVSFTLPFTQDLGGPLLALALPATAGLVVYSLTCLLLREAALFYLPSALFAPGSALQGRPDRVEP